MQGDKYFFEAGAVQRHTDNGPERVIECDTSGLDAKKVSDFIGIEITHALNFFENGYAPSDADLDEVEKHAKEMQNNCVYGGGIILGLVESCRRFKELKEKFEKKLVS